jgi:hypothetical protein
LLVIGVDEWPERVRRLLPDRPRWLRLGVEDRAQRRRASGDAC